MAQWQGLAPVVALTGLVLLMGWIFFLRTTARSLGVIGIVLCVALAATVLWTLFYYNLVSSQSKTLVSWIVLVLFSAILAAACRGAPAQSLVGAGHRRQSTTIRHALIGRPRRRLSVKAVLAAVRAAAESRSCSRRVN